MGGSVLPSKTSNRAIRLPKKDQRETTKILVVVQGGKLTSLERALRNFFRCSPSECVQ
jgi:hypothetical protein